MVVIPVVPPSVKFINLPPAAIVIVEKPACAVAVTSGPTKFTFTTVPEVPTTDPSSLMVIPEITDPPPTPVSCVPSPTKEFAVNTPDTFTFPFVSSVIPVPTVVLPLRVVVPVTLALPVTLKSPPTEKSSFAATTLLTLNAL